METSKFCSACGNGLIATAAICPNCGTPVPGTALASKPVAKSKTVAVVLAVFLGFWTYLYTYAKDKSKFWITLGISVVASITAMVTISVAAAQATKYSSCIYSAFDWTYFEENYDMSMCDMYSPNYSGLFIASAIQLGLLVYIIVDRARKSQEYYTNYPN